MTSVSDPGVAAAAKAGRKRTKSIVTAVQLLIALVVAAAVGRGLLSAALNDGGDHAEHQESLPGLPPAIAGLGLVGGSSGGPQAMRAVEGLHGKDVGIVDARIGEYEKGVIVWVGVAADASAAARLTDQMTTRIGAGNSPFRHVGESLVAEARVHQLVQGSQMHFFYQKANEVIWVAAPPGAGAQFVNAAVQVIP